MFARDDAYVLGDLAGKVRHPERFSRRFRARLEQVQRKHADLPEIRLHDLRHTHATILLREGVSRFAALVDGAQT